MNTSSKFEAEKLAVLGADAKHMPGHFWNRDSSTAVQVLFTMGQKKRDFVKRIEDAEHTRRSDAATQKMAETIAAGIEMALFAERFNQRFEGR